MNRPSGERSNSSSPRRLKLRFGNKISDPVLTGKPISGEAGTPLKIELVDENTNLIITTGPQSSGRVEITVLRADTKSDGKEGNKSLLNGCTYLDLSEGIGLVGNISFPHRSTWTKRCKYKLTARFVDDFDGISVIEAKSEVFTLEDRRNKQYEKHHPPTLSDGVLHLVNIRKGGSYEKALKAENIITVKNLLTEHFKDHQRLKEILKMPEKNLNDTIEHALTCKELEDKYIYCIPNSPPQMGIVLNAVGQLFGQISSCVFVPIETLSETQKDDAQKLVESALDHWGDVIPYKEDTLFSGPSYLVSSDHTLSITGYDYGPPCISSPNNMLLGTSHVNRYDHNPPITSHGNGTFYDTPIEKSQINDGCNHTQPGTLNGSLSDILIEAYQLNRRYDHMEPSTSYANDTFSNSLIGASEINRGHDHMQPSASLFSPDCYNVTSHDNLEYNDAQPNADPGDVTPLNDTISKPFGGTSDGVYSCPPNLFDFSIDEYYRPDEWLKKDTSKARLRKWRKWIFVLKFSHRMKMEKPGRVQKKPRFN